MFKILIVADQSEELRKLSAELEKKGFISRIAPKGESTSELLAEHGPDLVLVDLDGSAEGLRKWGLTPKLKQEMNLSLIALVSPEALGELDPAIDDFVVRPCQWAEVMARIKRILWRRCNIDSEDLIKYGDLAISPAKCEVTLCGRLIDLAYREYELLKFLATNKDRVFNREALLNKVWGYDYFGGERTVDVHVRRLRSKIEDAQHTFIETVRNIGYRFKA